MTSRCRGPGRDMSRKKAKQCLWNFLTISTKRILWLQKSAYWIHLELLYKICNSANSRGLTVENIWYWTWGYFVPMHKRLKFLGCTNGPLTILFGTMCVYWWVCHQFWVDESPVIGVIGCFNKALVSVLLLTLQQSDRSICSDHVYGHARACYC